MLDLDRIQKDITELPEEAQTLLVDFIALLKKCYSLPKKPDVNSGHGSNPQLSPLEILKESGLIGCISDQPDLSTHYKSALQQELDSKYDRR